MFILWRAGHAWRAELSIEPEHHPCMITSKHEHREGSSKGLPSVARSCLQG